MFDEFLRKARFFMSTFIKYTFSKKVPDVHFLTVNVMVTYYHGEKRYMCLLSDVPHEKKKEKIISEVEDAVSRCFSNSEHSPMPNRALYSDKMNVERFNMFLGPFGDFHKFLDNDLIFPYTCLPVHWNLFLNNDENDDDSVFVIDSLMNEKTTSSMSEEMFLDWRKDIILCDSTQEEKDDDDDSE